MRSSTFLLCVVVVGALLPGVAAANSVPCAIEGDFVLTAADGPWMLDCQAVVTPGATLTIEAGTTIKAASDASAPPVLVVARGAKIMAEGTADAPITFTSADESPAAGAWGGVVVLGAAPIAGGASDAAVEGIEGYMYGGDDAADNSGVISYVRIWFAGAVLGPDNELNGLTLAGVGSSTVVDYVEVAMASDDGIECFGGRVNLKHIVVAYCGDDGFDVDQGYQGSAQFVVVVVGENGNRAFEMDSKLGKSPRSFVQVSNALVVAGADSPLHLREGLGGSFVNMIITNVAPGVPAIQLSDCESPVEYTQMMPMMAAPDFLYISPNNIVSPGSEPLFSNDETCPATMTMAMTGMAPMEGNMYSVTDVSAFESVDTVPSGDFFTAVDFKGAVGTEDWLAGWTFLSSA